MPYSDNIDYIGVLECVIDVVRNVTNEYELTALWHSRAPSLKTHLENIKLCTLTDYQDSYIDDNYEQNGNSAVVEECFGVAAYREFLELLKEVCASE